MLIDLKKTLFLVAAAPLALGACSGSDKTPVDPEQQPDAASSSVDAMAAPDANTGPDAAPDPTFSGTISLAEVQVTNPPLADLGVAGAVVNVSFIDPANVNVAPQPGYTSNVGACRIFVYDVAAGESAPGGSDGGAVTIAGTGGSDASSFGCGYNATADRYLCSSSDSAASGVMPIGTTLTKNSITGTATLSIAGADFSNETYRGMSIILSGFPESTANGRFSILSETASTLTISHPGLAASSTLVAASGYKTLIGTGPFPGGTSNYNFLDDGTNPVTITKGAATNAPAVNTTLKANGQGFALASNSALPHAVPTDGTAVTFSCAGSCGTNTNGILKGIVVFGSTTDGVVSPANPTAMPAPVSKYATFQCSGIGSDSISLDAGAMGLILGTNPTRIQTSVTYGNAQLEGKNTIILSHGVVGFTDTAN